MPRFLLKLVKQWVLKSPKILITFADMSIDICIDSFLIGTFLGKKREKKGVHLDYNNK